ncbi:hypothetical protein RRG08_065264 [Elysia crispata]|uniref:Uncharacterized protein n=1 Tax=Elysia crispata TaxID=231223 RepID=A0AAE1D9L0_9GAST|nr:hypothetical protein RRG08_065264 [Elysia crispata]
MYVTKEHSRETGRGIFLVKLGFNLGRQESSSVINKQAYNSSEAYYTMTCREKACISGKDRVESSKVMNTIVIISLGKELGQKNFPAKNGFSTSIHTLV